MAVAMVVVVVAAIVAVDDGMGWDGMWERREKTGWNGVGCD